MAAPADGKTRAYDVTSGDIDRLLEQVMLKNDEPSVDLTSIANDLLPVLKDLLDSNRTARNVKIWE
jgi:hypothetical protein